MRRRASSSEEAGLTVLESFREIRAETNPYIAQLAKALTATPGVNWDSFSWPRALFGHVDVYHVHWPEITMGGHNGVGRFARRTLTAAFYLRLLLTRTPVVRTWHNTERPSDLGKVDHWLLDVLDGLTTLRIRLNPATPMPLDAPHVTILHGHYREWYAPYARSPQIPGRVSYVGLVRRYKGVEDLIQAFSALPGDVSLLIAGKPSTQDQADRVTRMASADARIQLRLAFLDDEEFVQSITGAQLLVLPYRHMHNSGAVLAALSLARPVLVPDNEVNRQLADEVGHAWVHRYQEDLGEADIASALRRTAADQAGQEPDLSAREWEATGSQHLAGFVRAVEIRGDQRVFRRRRALPGRHPVS